MNDESATSGVTPAGVSWEFRAEKTGRITIGLTKRAVEELEALQARTGLSKTDLINRSIDLYKFVTDQLDDHAKLLIRDRDGETMRVHIQ
jgi:hypothetical protein